MKKVLIAIVFVLAFALIGGGIYLSLSGDDNGKDKGKDKEEVTEKSDFTCSLEIEKLADYTVNFIEEVYLTDGMVTKSVPFIVIKCNSLDVLKQFKDTDDGEMGKVYDEKALTIKYPNGDPNIFKVENEGDMLVGKADYISSYKTAGYVCE